MNDKLKKIFSLVVLLFFCKFSFAQKINLSDSLKIESFIEVDSFSSPNPSNEKRFFLKLFIINRSEFQINFAEPTFDYSLSTNIDKEFPHYLIIEGDTFKGPICLHPKWIELKSGFMIKKQLPINIPIQYKKNEIFLSYSTEVLFHISKTKFGKMIFKVKRFINRNSFFYLKIKYQKKKYKKQFVINLTTSQNIK